MRRTAKTLKSWAAARGQRGVIKQAARDLERGRANTDCRAPDPTSEPYCPRPARRRKR